MSPWTQLFFVVASEPLGEGPTRVETGELIGRQSGYLSWVAADRAGRLSGASYSVVASQPIPLDHELGEAIHAGVERNVDGHAGINEVLDRLDRILVELRKLAIAVHEVDTPAGGNEKVPLDVRVASDVKRDRDARSARREALEQGVVQSPDDLCVEADDYRRSGVVTDDDVREIQSSSLSGYGVEADSRAPSASGGAATPPGGDIVRGATDTPPGSLSTGERAVGGPDREPQRAPGQASESGECDR